jgi:hypothetical protein
MRCYPDPIRPTINFQTQAFDPHFGQVRSAPEPYWNTLHNNWSFFSHPFQCGSGYGIRILGQCGYGSRIVNCKIFKWKKIMSFWSIIPIYLSPRPPRRTSSYWRSLQPSKENIQHFKTWKFLWITFASWIPKSMRIRADPDPKRVHRMPRQSWTVLENFCLIVLSIK